jgi:hypothetical protein
MDELGVRILLLLNVVIPLVFFMATVYLALHIVVARLIVRSDSPVLWFFATVTGPLTRPVRAALPSVSERRIRSISLAVYVVLWIAARALLHHLTALGAG